MDKGLVHLYFGQGKGKTTAAMGLCLRALGQGMRVTVVQFLKSGTSGELRPLAQLGAGIYSGKAGTKFVFQMTEEEKRETREMQTRNLREALSRPCDLLVLDEACAAVQNQMVDEALLKRAVLERPENTEVVLTGREPADWMIGAADYITEMRCERHPYDRGITARKGVEF